MFKYAKLSFLIFLAVVSTVTLYILISTYINDPLQVWHKPFYRPIKYSLMRESAQARMRNNKFDSIIIGNSWSECTSSQKANEILGGNFINLSMAGSNMPEKNLMLKWILKHYKVKRIVYILDTHYLNLEKKSTYTDSWTILYDDNPFNDINIYFNDKFLPCNIIFCDMDKLLTHTDIDKAYDWEKEEMHNRRFGGFQNWLKYYPVDDQIKEQFYIMYKLMDFLYVQDIDNAFKNGIQKYLDEYIFQLVKDNPDVEFDFVISPRCKLQLAIDIRTDSFQKMMYVLRAFVSENEKYKNLKLFAFDDEDAIGKVEDYKDGSHYRSWINHYILEAIKNNKNIITSTNYYDYLRNVFLQAKNVDFNEYKQQVQEIYVEK